ncbi:unnamed protein product [Adineta ricciae]|uniref:EGF-like domain-containing protein n=2 Tax=Adineta ricciae TaxID=249248 RepID=A0A813MVH8_ADIRI|nr:unnamed protein product [Adineta ricciae]
MVQWLIIILVYNFAILKLSLGEVTLALRLLHYKNRNGLTYENRACDTRLEHDINRDGRCDTGFLFCLVQLPFRNPHNCTLGDHFTGFVGADDIHFINIDQQLTRPPLTFYNKKQRSSLISLWFQPTIYFRFPYPKAGIGLIVEVYDIDDINNQTVHDSIDFYARTLVDLKVQHSREVAQPQRLFLRSLFGTYTNLTADFTLYCSPHYYNHDCETFCLPNEQRYDCDVNTGQKICKHGYIGQDCLSDVRACEDRPCLNNGTCVVYLRGYLCQCPLGYAGTTCEIGPSMINVDHTCSRATCVHGYCSRNGKCICHENWTSENCNQQLVPKTIDCASRPCLHNSTCEDYGDKNSSIYRCHCRNGFTGRNCEVEIVTSCERTPCVHGQCIKIDLYAELCICEKNWSGIDCSQSLLTSTMTTRTNLSTKKSDPVKTTLSMQTPSIKSVKDLSHTPVITDLSDYSERLHVNYGIHRNTNSIRPTTTPSLFLKSKYSPCLSAPCLHNSTCVIQSEHEFRCICSPAFIGIYCEIETNPCESSPCQHDSICIAKSNHDIQCICRRHYTGKYCEISQTFQPVPSKPKCVRICQHGGICLLREKQLLVYHRYSLCHTDPCLSNPCLYNGTCQSIISSTNYTCSCHEQYTGERCEFVLKSDSVDALPRDSALSQDEPSPTDFWPLAIVFGYVFSLMLVFIIIWFLWYGLTIRPQSHFRSDIPYGERPADRYQPYRLGVSNPLFFTNQDYNPNRILKTFSIERDFDS